MHDTHRKGINVKAVVNDYLVYLDYLSMTTLLLPNVLCVKAVTYLPDLDFVSVSCATGVPVMKT